LNGNYFLSSSETSPIFGYYGGTNSDGNELWRIYMPTKKKYRFLSNWSASRIQGSTQLPKSGDHCILIKSMKDLMLLDEFGITALSTISENVLISQSQFNKIETRFTKNILVFFDNDLAGVKGAKKYKKEYGIRCIFIKRKYAKDLSDLYKKVSSNVFWGIVEELYNILADTSVKKTKHFYVF
jgi:5S rRNA maturation endonuclease (ribonuclease M5)